MLLFPDAFSKKAIIPTCFPSLEVAFTLVTSRSEDAFIDLIAKSILGATMLTIAVKNAFCILSSTINVIAHFPVNPLIETPFQSFHIHRTFINGYVITRSTNDKILVTSTSLTTLLPRPP